MRLPCVFCQYVVLVISCTFITEKLWLFNIYFAYKCCRDCDYTWDTQAAWDAGKGRVAFSYPAEDIKDGDVVCSLCYKGEEEYFPSDDEDED